MLATDSMTVKTRAVRSEAIALAASMNRAMIGIHFNEGKIGVKKRKLPTMQMRTLSMRISRVT